MTSHESLKCRFGNPKIHQHHYFCQSSASVMGLLVSSPPSDYLVGIMLLSVVSTKDCHIMPSDPEPAGQSRRRGLPKLPQHYTRPCLTLVPATGPRKKAAPVSGRSSKVCFSFTPWRRPWSNGIRLRQPTCGATPQQLAGKRDLRPLHAAPLCHLHCPALQGGEPRRSCEHNMRRLEQCCSHHGVTNPADTAVYVGLAGLIFLRRQPEICADGS